MNLTKKSSLPLDRKFLHQHLADFCGHLAAFLNFGGYALYFPETASAEPELIGQERRLLLPLVWQDKFLGVLRLDGVDGRKLKSLLRFLPQIVGLCLENMALAQAMGRDAETGLLSEEALLVEIAEKIATISPDNAHKLCLGLLVASAHPIGNIPAGRLSDALSAGWRKMAAAFQESLPGGALAARLGICEGRRELGALFSALGRGYCHSLAKMAAAALDAIKISDPLSGTAISGFFSLGHALYPQDMSGHELRLAPLDQAIILRNRARLAGNMAWQNNFPPILGYGWLQGRAGRIISCPNRHTASINLGSLTNARKGQRYHVIDQRKPFASAFSKAQITVLNVEEQSSVAAISWIAAADDPPHVGDRLILIPDLSSHTQENASETKIMSHAQFLERFSIASKASSNFSLILTEFWQNQEDAGNSFHGRLAKFLSDLPLPEGQGAFMAHYGGNGLILFLPASVKAENTAKRLYDRAKAAGIQCACGIFSWPFLNFSKAESENCVLKALTYAKLLPDPHIGKLDGMALAISGDKLFSQGDELGAMAEYRLALLAQPDDPMILNSLGVCMAALNKLEEAKALFLKALNNCEQPDLRAKICYNLGNCSQKNEDVDNALKYYRQCIRELPGHIFAWIKLGQIYATFGKLNAAAGFFKYAAKLAEGDSSMLAIAKRQLARLENRRNNQEISKEMLHDALLRDPGDTASLLLLARTYLADDPAMAETLARRCLRYGADSREVLKLALAAQGNQDKAGQI